MEKLEEPESWADPFCLHHTPECVSWVMQSMLVGDKMLVMSQMNPWCDFTHFIWVIPRTNLSQNTEDSQSCELKRIAVHGKMAVLSWLFELDCESSESGSKLCLQLGFDTVSWITFTVPESVAWSSQQHCINKQWAMQSCQNKLISKLAAGFLQPLAKLWQYKQGHLQGGPPRPLYFKRFKDLFLNI